MGRRIGKPRRHSSGQAFVEFRRKRYYLGVYGSPQATKRYHKLLGELMEQRDTERVPERRPRIDGSLTVSELVLHFWKHAEGASASARR